MRFFQGFSYFCTHQSPSIFQPLLQRDYIHRLIQEFARALAQLLRRKELSERRKLLEGMYNQYVGPYTELSPATIEQVMDYMQRFAPEERLQRMQMLAELYLAEADTVGKITADMLLDKAYFLFDFIQTEGHTFSLDMHQKMSAIQSRRNS